MPFDISYLEDEKFNDQPDLDQPLWRKALYAITTPIRPILDLLNYPGDTVRGLLAGKGLESFIPGEEHQTSGNELLQKLGIVDEGNIGTELAASIATDPLIFLSSITGATKAGRAAATLGKTTKELEFAREYVKPILGVSDDLARTGANRITGELIPELEKRIDDLVGQGVKPLGATRAEQIALGQRGIELSVPFTDLSYRPDFLNQLNPMIRANEVIGKIGESIGNFGPISKMGQLVKKYFSTAKESEVGQLLTDTRKLEQEASLQAASEFTKIAQKEFDDYAKQINKPVDELKKAVTGHAEAAIDFNAARDKLQEANKSINDVHAVKEADITRQLDLIKNDPSIPALYKQIGTDLLKEQQKKLFASTNKQLRQNMMKYLDLRNKQLAHDGFATLNPGLPTDFSEMLKKLGEDSLELEQAIHSGITPLVSEAQAYIKHSASLAGKQYFANDEVAQAWLKEVFAKTSAMKQRGLTDNINKLNESFRKRFKLDFDVFVDDPAVIYGQRQYLNDTAVMNYRLIRAATAMAGSDTGVPLAKVLKETGYEGWTFPDGSTVTWQRNSSEQGIQSALKKHVAANGMQNEWKLAIEPEVYKDIVSRTALQKSDTANLVSQVLDPVNVLYKTGILGIFPASLQQFGTQLLGNFWANIVAGVNPLQYRNAITPVMNKFIEARPNSWTAKLIGQKAVPEATAKEFNLFEKLGGLHWTQAREFREALELGSDVSSPAGKMAQRLENIPGIGKTIPWGFEVNQAGENMARFAHFLSKRAEGFSPTEAMRSVNKYLFDYSDLTQFEKDYGKRLLLFYTFNRKMIPLAVAETLNNRKAYLIEKFIDGTLKNDDFVPTYLKDTGNIKLGPGHFLDLKNPLYTANILSSQGGDPQRVLDRMITPLSPALRIPYELLTGREAFRGRDLTDLTRVDSDSPYASLPGTTQYETKTGTETRLNPVLAYLMRNLPTSRMQGSISNFFEQDVSPIKNFLGIKERTMNPEQLKLRMTQEELIRQLNENPEIRKMTDYYTVAQEPQRKTQILLEALDAANKQLSASYKETMNK